MIHNKNNKVKRRLPKQSESLNRRNRTNEL